MDNWQYGMCNAMPPGDHPATVTIGETRIIKRDGRTVEEREVKEVPYPEWDGRCKFCYP